MSQSPAPSALPRPPYDAELGAMLASISDQLPGSITPEMIPILRAAQQMPALDDIVAGRDIVHEERTIAGPLGAPEVVVSIFRKREHLAGSAGIFFVHGGGMIMGDRFSGVAGPLEWVDELDAVLVTVEYRLAPENPDPAPLEDVYAALLWTAEHADELGFDGARLLIAGESAGGGLAAGATLRARDTDGPALIGSLLIYPMLDDRDASQSGRQFDGIGIWDRASNRTAWAALLGERAGGDEVSSYAAPARATNYSDLPPTYIEVGSAEVFRDEDVAYASAIWAAGGACELHVWPGAFHGSDLFGAHIRQNAIRAQVRSSWVRRLLS